MKLSFSRWFNEEMANSIQTLSGVLKWFYSQMFDASVLVQNMGRTLMNNSLDITLLVNCPGKNHLMKSITNQSAPSRFQQRGGGWHLHSFGHNPRCEARVNIAELLNLAPSHWSLALTGLSWYIVHLVHPNPEDNWCLILFDMQSAIYWVMAVIGNVDLEV